MENIEKIEINGHYVWVDKDAEIKEGDWFYSPAVKDILYASKEMLSWNSDTSQKHKGWVKIIASSLELNLKGVPTYVEWLAEKEYPKAGFGLSVECKRERKAFIKGYQTAEKELPTWDDVRKAIELARLIKEDGSVEDSFTAEDISGCTEVCTYGWGNRHSEEEIIEQLKQSKNK